MQKTDKYRQKYALDDILLSGRAALIAFKRILPPRFAQCPVIILTYYFAHCNRQNIFYYKSGDNISPARAFAVGMSDICFHS